MKKYRKTLFLLILIYCLIASWFAILRFRAFNAGFVDLGRMEQAVWSTLQGDLLINTFEYGNASRFIVHSEPILFLLSPFYFIFQRTEFLLIIQSLVLGLAVLPLYQICKVELKDEKLALIFSLCYLLYPSIFYINMSDFHPDSFAILFIFSAFYFMLTRRWFWFWIMIALLLSTREYFGLVVAFWGIYMFFEYKDKRRAIILCLLGAIWFLFAFFVLPRLFPEAQVWRSKISPLVESGLQTKGLFKNILALLMPLGFLSLLCLKRLFIALPLLLAFILAGQLSYANHHAAGIIPFVFIAAIGALTLKSKRNSIKFGLVLISMTIFTNQLYGASPASIRFYLPGDYHYYRNEHNFKIESHDTILDEFVKSVPAKAKVTASNHIGAHLARRKYINYFPYPEDLSKVSYILVDLKNPTSVPWLKWQVQVDTVKKLMQDSNFLLLRSQDDIYLFKKRI